VSHLLTAIIPFLEDVSLFDFFIILVEPRIIVPEHDYSKRPLQLFWFDGLALQAIAESEEEMVILTEVEEDSSSHEYPLKPPLASVADFKTTPLIHVGYATTWFGLSAAGIYMTRKLVTRGRG
jgi:cytochrome oxidase assembly protein ShyY1